MQTTHHPTTRRRRPPAAAAEEAVASLGRAVGSLRCAGSQRLVRLGISMTHFHVLTLLRHHDAMPMGRLAEILDASMSSATGIIDRMEERGLVERVRVPDDRRVVLVRPTQAGLDLVDEAELVKSDVIASALERLTVEQLERLAIATADLRAALEAELAASPERYADLDAVLARTATPPGTTRRTATASPTPAPPAPDERNPLGSPCPRSTTTAPTHGLGALDLPHRAKMEILFAILLGLFLGALDQTIVAVALPTIVTELGGQSLLTWTITIYLLTSTITVPFYGKLSDLYGRKPMLMIGITIFLIGSALSGLSQNMTQLIIFRGIQGLGAGALFPISLAVIGDLFTPAGARQVPGPVRGRVRHRGHPRPAPRRLADRERVSWHWIFFVNIPIGIVALAVIGRLLPTVKRPDASHNFDYLGGAVFTVARRLVPDRPDQQADQRLGHLRRSAA